MYYNTIIILMGIFVVIIALYILLQKKDKDFSYDELISNTIKKDINNLENMLKKNQLQIMDGIDKLNIEINTLKENIKTDNQLMVNILRQENFNLMKENNTEIPSDDFGYLLNYNKFLQKNKDIIALLKKNKTPEDIAKELNKSIREVEMVLKLAK